MTSCIPLLAFLLSSCKNNKANKSGSICSSDSRPWPGPWTCPLESCLLYSSFTLLLLYPLLLLLLLLLLILLGNTLFNPCPY